MKYSDKQIDALRDKVRHRLSEKRYLHTLGVENMAMSLSEYFSGLDKSEICAAALLHDITKELSIDENLKIIDASGIDFSKDDRECVQIYHSFSAPYVILRDFPDFATDNILSAVRNHTTGAQDMTLFDEIIFISDYIEEGRTYDACIEVRKYLFDEFDRLPDEKARVESLHKASLKSIENTIFSILKQGRKLNQRTELTKKALFYMIGKNGDKNGRK